MRSARPILALLAAGLLAACAEDPKPLIGGGKDPSRTWPAASACRDSARPTNCSREHRPVCARSETGEYRTYVNGCEACLDPSVVDFRAGACKVR